MVKVQPSRLGVLAHVAASCRGPGRRRARGMVGDARSPVLSQLRPHEFGRRVWHRSGST